jgi:hypothetical protein
MRVALRQGPDAGIFWPAIPDPADRLKFRAALARSFMIGNLSLER